MKIRAIQWGLLGACLALAVGLRLADLSRVATRSDEMNFLRYAAEGVSSVELWKNPPFQNQMPLADSIAILWAQAQPRRAVDAGLVREPFALFGAMTLITCVAWLWRRRGWRAAMLGTVWLGLSPFLVYHSREAYYYAVGMFFSTGMVLASVGLLERLERRAPLSAWDWTIWAAWVCVSCLCHMAIWALAGALALLLWVAGWNALRGPARRQFFFRSSVVYGLLLLAMSRWIWRAIGEIVRVSKDPTIAHIGNPFSWMAPRILPVFFGGANAVGVGLLAATLGASVWAWRCRRNGTPAAGAARMDGLSRAVWLGFAAMLVYVGMTGGGAGKWVYFSAAAPVLLVWAVCGWDRFWSLWGGRAQAWGMAGCTVAVAGLLALPAWKVTQLDGKPAAYRHIQQWLDENLSPGDVAIVDRWYEPWNEMALYAPSNVTVTFTVPDEPYEQYVGLNWRKTTQSLFERNGAQAFIRIARNHEKRAGLWSWPEKWFAHRAVVTNAAGVWLRDTGFAPMEEFYSETNRVATEIFYDTHADVAARARAAGQDAVWFFGAGWRLFKPWQQGDFTDYRVLEGEGAMEIHNLRDVPVKFAGEIVAAAMGGEQRVRIGDAAPLAFPEGRLERRTFALELSPGVQTLRWKKLGAGGALLVREFRLARAE